MESQTRKNLIDCSKKLFLQFGYSKVTMDEIAREMGISKKTIYQLFPSKVKLVEEVILDMKAHIVSGVKRIANDSQTDTLDKLRQVFVFTAAQFAQITPFVVEDLSRNVPQLWNLLKEVKYELAFKNIRSLIQEAQKSGHIKADVEVELLLFFYSACFQHVMDRGFQRDFPQEIREKVPSTPEQIFEQWVNMSFEGILGK